MAKKDEKFTSFHVSIAAEAIATAQFARVGIDVSVQYGANQPEYDLIIAKESKLLKVSVKGSKSGSWGLTQKFLKNGDYQRAIDLWQEKHTKKTIFCFVQFKDKDLDEIPNVYLATVNDIAQRLRKTKKDEGYTTLYENKTYKAKKAKGYGTTDKIPESWKFSKERVEELLDKLG